MHKHMREWGEEPGLLENFDSKMLSDREEIASISHHKNIDDGNCPVEKSYKIRRERDSLFVPGLFSDPAWDILLDLYISEKAGKKICITSACIAAGVPASTGLRWIAILVQNGYVEREEDPADARRSFVSLTPTARGKLERLFGKTGNVPD